MKPVVVLGIFNGDTSYRAKRMPKQGESILGSSFALGPGGKGSNQAVAAAKAMGAQGAGVHFITRLGDDQFAAIAREVWAKAGVKPVVKVDPESHTGAAFIFVNEDSGDNAIIVTSGAGGRIAPEDLDEQKALIENASVFVTQLEQPIEAARRGLEIAKAAGVTTILNPAPAAALDDEMLALCDFLTPNESEAETLTGLPVTTLAEAEAAADALRARGVGNVLITLGENGALLRNAQGSIHVPVFKAGPVAETTGAGDSFNGGFAVALSEGKSLPEALRFAAAVAGISVTRMGAANSMPSRDEIEALLAKG